MRDVRPMPCVYCREAIPDEAFHHWSAAKRLISAWCPSCGHRTTVLTETWHHRGDAPDSAVEVALLDGDGVILEVNDAWRAFSSGNGGDTVSTGVGASYLAACSAAPTDPSALAVASALRRALSGDLPEPLTVRIPCDRPDAPRFFDILISARVDPNGRSLGAAVTLSPVRTLVAVSTVMRRPIDRWPEGRPVRLDTGRINQGALRPLQTLLRELIAVPGQAVVLNLADAGDDCATQLCAIIIEVMARVDRGAQLTVLMAPSRVAVGLAAAGISTRATRRSQEPDPSDVVDLTGHLRSLGRSPTDDLR
jgi:hypothetical protein